MGLLGVTLPALYTAAVAGTVHAGAGSEWTAQRRELLQTAGCDFLITTSTASESVILGAEAAAEATAVVCGSGSATDRIEVVAETSARAAATAVANVAGSCYANGNGSFKVNGLTIAQTEATAYAEAFAEGTVSASACGRCTAVADFVAESWSRIFFDAVAEAEFRLQGAANGGSVTSATAAFVEAVAEATVVAFASVLATASASADDGCNVSLLTITATGDVDDTDETFCDVNVAGEANTVAQNAVVSAVFEAEAFACEGRAESAGRVAAQELAIATAEAISSVVADCSVIGNGFACALGEADVNTMAQATADAFARGFVNAVSQCDPPRCTINVEIITENTASVLVRAASEAYDAACAGPNESFSLNEVEEDIASATIDALAEVIISAVVDGDDCSASLNLQADVTTTSTCDGECAANNKKCGGRDFPEVLHCCSDDYLCVKKNNNYMQCRLNGTPGSRGTWDGSIVTCGKQ